MNILTSYIVKEIIKGSLISMLILVTLVNLFTFKDELGHLGEGAYGYKEMLLYVLFTTPVVIYELMPSAALLGSLFVLGAMVNNRELVAMRIAGMSMLGLLRSILLAGLFLSIFSIVVGEFIAPPAGRAAKVIRLEAKTQNKQIIWQSMYGIWLRDGDSFINVRKILGEGDLANVSIYMLNENGGIESLTHAERVKYLGRDRWSMEGVNLTEIGLDQVTADHFEQKYWQSSIDPGLLDIVLIEPDNLSLYDLAMYIKFLRDNNQKVQVYEFAFWGRVINPLITIVMLLVATPFVIGTKRAQSMGPRMLIGVVFGMAFNVFDKIIGNVGLVYDFNPVLLSILPSALVATGAIYAISRLR